MPQDNEKRDPDGDASLPSLDDLDTNAVTSPHDVEHNEKIVEEGFWPKIRRLAGRLPFAEDLVAAYYCAMDPASDWKVRAVLMAALAYFVMPVDVLPDVLAGLGYTDDAGVLAAAIKVVASHITDRHRSLARTALARETPGPE